MANLIEKVRITNPHDVEDVCSHIMVDQNNSTLSITNWMTEVGTYTVQFWYKSTASRTLSVTCAGETTAVNSTTSWNKFTHTYVASTTSGLQIAMPVGEYWFYNMKAERGTAPSDWSPHPEDVSDEYNIDLIKMADTISVVESNVDANARAITNKLEITTFETEMEGVQNSLDRIGEGYDKWLVSVYNISDMNDLYDEDTDTTTAISGVYDITAFSDENADVNPANELLIQDEMESIYTPVSSLSGKMLYYLTYVNFTEATAVTTNFTHGKCTLYLNGAPVLKTDSTGTNQVILNFALGWNVIEIVSNQAGAKFAINISDHEKCYSMNCLMATPNARSVKIKRQFSNVNQYIDKIEMNVGTTITELREDLQGQIDQIETSQGTQYEQTTTKFSWLITDGSTSSNLTFTNAALTAMTNQFEVKDSDGNSVVISKGNVKANSITAKMLSTDAITSSNYQQTVASGSSEPHYATQGTKLDLANGNFISPSLYINATSGNAWFKGDIHADNGYFNGEISSTKGTIGPWNIEDGYIWKGSKNFADGSAAGNIYLGNSGMSFGNKLVYDATKGTLNLNVNSLSIGNSDLSEYVTAYNGDNVFYTNTIPTVSNYPASTWTTEADKIAHLDSICYDTSTGKLYKFTKTDRKIKITFSSSSATNNYQNDYLWIYYQKDGARYRTGYTSTRAMGTPGIAGASVVIPAESFWIWWHSNSDSTTDYGFKIDSVAVTSDAADAATASNLPNYTQRKLKPGELPETSHPYGANENFLWYVRPVLSGGTYVWQEVSVDGINLLSLSQLTSGGATISNESFVLSAQYGGSTDYFRIPSSVFNGNKSYCLSFKFKKNSTPTTGNTLNNMYIKFPSGLIPYYATLDGTDILSSINSAISVTDSTTEHTVQIKLNKTSSGNIDVYFNYNQATSVYMILSEIMLQEGTQFTEWSPSKKDLVSNIIASKASENNYMWYDAANGLVIYNGRDANGNLYVIDGTTNTVSGLTTGNIRMTSSGLDLYKGQTLLTSYGETTTFYKYGSTTAAATLNSSGLHIANGSITLGNNFSVDSSGNLVCSNASVSGTITATSGYIGSGTYKITLGDGTISYGMTRYTDTTNNGFWISSDGIALGGGKFKVSNAGELTASSGTFSGGLSGATGTFSGSLSGATGSFTGSVTATSGYIGNGTYKITLGDGSISYGMTSYNDTSHDGFWISSDGIALGKGAFKVSNNGTAVVTGTINATGGYIGDNYNYISIGNGCIYKNYSSINSMISAINTYEQGRSYAEAHGEEFFSGIADGFYIGIEGFGFVSGKGYLCQDGQDIITDINSGGGSSGGSSIDLTNISSNVEPSSNNSYSLGASNYQWSSIYGGTIYENGTSLSNKYAAKTHYHNYASSSHTHSLTSLSSGSISTISRTSFEYYVVLDSSGDIRYYSNPDYDDSGEFVPGTEGSSIRFKNVSRNLSHLDTDSFYSVKPVLASYKNDYLPEDHYWQGIKMPMLIAEDIEKVYPGAVIYDKEGQVKNYSDHLVVSVHQQMLIDQKQEIESLKREITALKQLLNK